MRYLTAREVLYLHAVIIDESGGSHGVRDLGLLESAVARPRATFQGDDLHPDLFFKAATLVESLIGNHPFVDGNERTGVAAASLFLEMNGRVLTATDEELVDFAVRVAREKPDLPAIGRWLESHSEEER